jgi:diacylglycerol O-acyltransferase / wax synthase
MTTRTHRKALVENVIEIARSSEEVFDYWVDLEREPEWNLKAKRVEKLTDGPIGLGTQFEGEYLKGDAMTIEYVRFERPVSWETVGRSPRLNVKGEGRLTTTERGTRLVMRMELSPKGALRLLAPILGRFMHQQQKRNLAAIKQALEGSDAPAARRGPEPSLND